MTYETELAFAKDMASRAGVLMKQYYRQNQNVEIKSDNSPVTIADKEINNLLIERVMAAFPSDGVLGEEASWEAGRSRLWVCDPIDGTVAYIMHVPTSMFSLALVENGKPVLAVAYNPWVDELYSAVLSQGAYRNNEKIVVSQKSWGPGVYLTGSPGSEQGNKERLQAQKIYLNTVQGGVQRGCLIAEGAIEGCIFKYDGAHDMAAVKLIIEEAGGKVTDLAGNEQRYDQPINGAIMSNGLIHAELMELHENSRH